MFKKAFSFHLSFLFLLSFNINAQQDFYWIGGDGDWNVASNWSSTSGGAPDKVFSPTQNDNVYFDAGSFNTSAIDE